MFDLNFREKELWNFGDSQCQTAEIVQLEISLMLRKVMFGSPILGPEQVSLKCKLLLLLGIRIQKAAASKRTAAAFAIGSEVRQSENGRRPRWFRSRWQVKQNQP